MALKDFVDRLTLLRRFVSSTERIAKALEQQNLLLARLADRYAPVFSEPSESDLAQTGAFTRNQGRLARLEEWTEQFIVRHGREPIEQEIEEWLGEDAERALQ